MAFILPALVICVTTTQNNCQQTSIQKLQFALSSELLAHQEKFVVSFQGINPAQLLYPNNIYQQYATFSSDYNTKINETSVRFTNVFSIFLVNSSVDKEYTKNIFYDFFLRPSSIFFLFTGCHAGEPCKHRIIPTFIFNCPALKLYVYPHSDPNTNALLVALSANGYFQHRVVPIDKVMKKGLLKTPMEFHKAYFWNGNLKKIPVGVNQFESYFIKYRHNTYICSQMVMNHKYNEKYMCTFDITTTIYFAEVHNMSLNMFEVTSEFMPEDDEQSIGHSTHSVHLHKYPTFILTGLGFSLRQSKKIIYCAKTTISSQSQFEYSVWTEPFPLNVWMLFIFSFVLVPYAMFEKGFGNKFEAIFALLSWQSISPKNGKFAIILMMFNLMFLSTSYVNEITSLMVAPLVPKPIQNLKELLDYGYKFVVTEDLERNVILDSYKEDFKRFNVSDKLNSSFHHVPRIQILTIATDFLANTKIKYATIVDEAFEVGYLPEFSKLVNEKDETRKCQSVFAGVSPASNYRVFYTVNRYWLFKTLQRIKDAGLDAKLKEVLDWTCILEEKVRTRGFVEGGIGLIETTKFTPIFVLWAIVAIMAGVVLVFEAYLFGILGKVN